MNVQLEQRKIAGVVIEVSQILADKGFNRGEIIIGLSELIGRLIVDSVEDTIQAEELTKIASSRKTLHGLPIMRVLRTKKNLLK